MASETLGVVADIVMGQSPPGDAVTAEPIGLPLLNGPTEFGTSHPVPVQFTADVRKKAIPGDLLFCVRGSTTGRMNWADREYAIGRGIAAIRHKEDGRVQPFVRAVIECGLSDLLVQATGSTFPNVSASQLAAIPYPEIDINTQRSIAHILGTFDAKVELNRRMNETLEAIARAIFKSWFVDFDPVRAKASGESTESICRRLGLTPELLALFPDRFVDSDLGEIPEGWATESLYEMATYVNGAAYSAFEPNELRRGLPIIKIAELKAGITAQTKYSDVEMPEKYRINRGDILFSWSGNPDTSIDTFVWVNGSAWLNQHIFRVLLPSELERSFLLVMLKHLRPVFAEIARNKQTTGLGHVTVSDLKRLKWVKPPKSVLTSWHVLIGPILDRMFLSESETQTLASHRDTLLPELLSGRLRVPASGDV